MTSYQKAIKALEECVKDAMENDINASTQSEIWRHYQGMKAIEKQVGRANLSFKLDGIDRVMDMYDSDTINYGAAQPVDLPPGAFGGQDVITFS